MKVVFLGQSKVIQPHIEATFRLELSEEDQQKAIDEFKKSQNFIDDSYELQYEPARIKAVKKL